MTRIDEIAFDGNNTSSTGQTLLLEYGTSSCILRTSGSDDVINTADDLLTTHSFDQDGRAVSIYTTDLSRTHLYGGSSGQYVGEENEKAKNNLKSSVQTSQSSANYLLNGGFEELTGGALIMVQNS